MADKKNEDFVVRMPEGSSLGGEKEPFLGRSNATRTRQESSVSSYLSKIDNSPPASILAYCFASISMTVVNKYVVSGSYWNLNFFYLAIQVCHLDTCGGCS